MSRNFILPIGALLWAFVIGDGIVHIVTGQWTTTAAMAIAGVTWVTLRRAPWSPVRAAHT
jgi:hypothetical protein